MNLLGTAYLYLLDFLDRVDVLVVLVGGLVTAAVKLLHPALELVGEEVELSPAGAQEGDAAGRGGGGGG